LSSEPTLTRAEPSDTPRRVLLMSPLAGLDPPGGDVSYTEALLADPPPGVVYIDYRDAIEAGTLRVRGRRPKHGRTSSIDAATLALRSMEQVARRSGAMFREPTWYVSTEPGAFDLIHHHLFPLRQIGARLPTVSSAGYPLSVLYAARERWSPRHVAGALRLESAYATAANIHNPWLRTGPRDVMTVYSRHFRDWLEARGAAPGRVLVAGTALPDLSIPAKRSDGRTLVVMARDFARKGGDIAMAAFARLRARDPSLRLIVATTAEAANAARLGGEGVEVEVDPPRRQVLDEILPRADVMLLPTRSDCGAPYGVLEALQSGTPVVTSTDPWLDERLEGPAVRRVEAAPDAVGCAAAELLRPDVLDGARPAARRLWETEFSMPVLHRTLLTAYEQASAP
jgi:glycosyltransferase involved in cell wall biosynthesis